MAGDWIKMRHNLHEHPKVLMIADTLQMDVFAVVGRLHRLWAWVDQHSETGRALVAPLSRIDALVGATRFADALKKVGWLDGEDGCLDFPGFEEHNGQTAKKRARNTQRQKKRRDTVSPDCRAESATEARPEKRREEKKNKNPQSPRAGGEVENGDSSFDAWWKSYPVRSPGTPRGNRTAAFRAWSKLSDPDRSRVVEATRRLIASGQIPKDAERFLRPGQGGTDPPWRSWLDDTPAASIASRAPKTAANRREEGNHEYDQSGLDSLIVSG